MKTMLLSASIAFCSYGLIVEAGTRCSTDIFGNVQCSDGGGWTTDIFGNIQGTGNNSGGGYTTDIFGNIRGTGNNSGTSCYYDIFQNLICN